MTESTAQKRNCRRDVLHTRRTVLASLAGLALVCATELHAEPVGVSVYTHADIDPQYLTRSFLRAVFSLRVRTWPDGQPIRVFVLDDSDPLHVRFCQEQLSTYPYVLRKSWNRTSYTGTGLLPVRVDSVEERQRRVERTEGAIGYMPIAPRELSARSSS